jgi:hypothetical protein
LLQHMFHIRISAPGFPGSATRASKDQCGPHDNRRSWTVRARSRSINGTSSSPQVLCRQGAVHWVSCDLSCRLRVDRESCVPAHQHCRVRPPHPLFPLRRTVMFEWAAITPKGKRTDNLPFGTKQANSRRYRTSDLSLPTRVVPCLGRPIWQPGDVSCP